MPRKHWEWGTGSTLWPRRQLVAEMISSLFSYLGDYFTARARASHDGCRCA